VTVGNDADLPSPGDAVRRDDCDLTTERHLGESPLWVVAALRHRGNRRSMSSLHL